MLYILQVIYSVLYLTGHLYCSISYRSSILLYILQVIYIALYLTGHLYCSISYRSSLLLYVLQVLYIALILQVISIALYLTGHLYCSISYRPSLLLYILQVIYVAENKFTSLPTCLGHLKQLKELDVSYCAIERLPESLPQCTSLAKLWVSNNR